MRLYGKEIIWCLNKVVFPYPTHFPGGAFLVFMAAKMLDHGIGKNDIKLIVPESTHVSCVACHAFKIRMGSLCLGEVKQNSPDAIP